MSLHDTIFMSIHIHNFTLIISDEMYWLEESPPPAMDALYQDYLHINELINFSA